MLFSNAYCPQYLEVNADQLMISSAGCTDIDDALHARVLESGNIEVGVHIADVTHFIRPGSFTDAEAAKRGTTVSDLCVRVCVRLFVCVCVCVCVCACV